jgi:hypothetical protein
MNRLGICLVWVLTVIFAALATSCSKGTSPEPTQQAGTPSQPEAQPAAQPATQPAAQPAALHQPNRRRPRYRPVASPMANPLKTLTCGVI